MVLAVSSIALLAIASSLFYLRASLKVWTIAVVLLLIFYTRYADAGYFIKSLIWLISLSILLPLNISYLRQNLVSRRLLMLFRQQMPKMSQTEKEALAAGTVGWEAELFCGQPNWNKFLSLPTAQLTEEEQAFLDGPVAQLCSMINDWEITHKYADLPPEIWQFLKEQGFFGLIIPKQYGGKQYSAYAHSEILVKIYGCSVTVGSTVAVPNSLGPAELLLHYGTEEQKNYYLPRLAKGEEIPCFALTGPEAGSDAASIPDTGIICKGQYDGKEVLGIRLNWNKRYITLAPVATVLGLAFKLYDPDHLLGQQEELGITCALIPTSLPGIMIGRRHFPLNAVFQNGPTQGKDVFIPIDWIIGGPAMAGHGWTMLMECLAAGRSISLPSGAVGGCKVSTAAASAYARIRKQFNSPIGYFEGIEEVLTRIAGKTYLIDAARLLTLATIDRGQKPAVISAILKYHATEIGREVANDVMDIHGGKGICLGPRNYIGRNYQAIPIAITVEGANILTRNLIIFGQGAIRCHPYILAEMEAAQDSDPTRALKAFDRALFGHIGYSLSNIVRALILALTNGWTSIVPAKVNHHYYRKFSRYSAAFALLADCSMLLLGGGLKRKEKLSARFGDILSMLYFGSAVMKRFHDEGEQAADLPLVNWACQTTLNNIVQRFNEILTNFPNRLVARILSFIIFPFGKPPIKPTDQLGHQVVELIIAPSATRNRLVHGVYLEPVKNNPVGCLNQALQQLIAIEPLEKRLHNLVREGLVKGRSAEERILASEAIGAMSKDEVEELLAAERLRKEIIAVDDFNADELIRQ